MAIGWGTNRLAIKMLFWPRRRYQLGPIVIQGLIPRRQSEIAERVADIVHTELLDAHVIREHAKSIRMGPYIEDYARRLIHEDLRKRADSVPLVNSFMGEQAWKRIESWLITEMKRESESLMLRITDDLEQHINIKEIVRDRMLSFDLLRLESMIYQLARKEFGMIERLGAIVGLLVGLLQLLLFLSMGWI